MVQSKIDAADGSRSLCNYATLIGTNVSQEPYAERFRVSSSEQFWTGFFAGWVANSGVRLRVADSAGAFPVMLLQHDRQTELLLVASPGARNVYVSPLGVHVQFFCKEILRLDASRLVERRQRKYHSACLASLLRPALRQRFQYIRQGGRIPFLKRCFIIITANTITAVVCRLQSTALVESTPHADDNTLGLEAQGT